MDDDDCKDEDCQVMRYRVEEALLEAVRQSDESGVSILGSLVADINYSNCTHKSALYFAIEHGNLEIVKLLVKLGANVEQTSYCSAHCVFELPVVTAARLQRFDIVRFLLSQGLVLDSHGKASVVGKTALQWAASYGDVRMAKLLHAHSADVNWIGPAMNTALHYAALADKADMVQWLLEHDTDITINCDGRTALHIASVRGNFPIVKHLLHHRCEINMTDSFSFTPFSLACLRGHLGIIKYFMNHSNEDMMYSVNDGLHRAAECGHLNVLTYLLSCNADVDSVNQQGETALSIAARGQFKSVSVLLEANAKIITVDKRGYTPLQHAVLREQIDIASMLIQHGANLHGGSENTESPLQICCTIANPLLIKCLLDAGLDLQQEPWFTSKVVFEKCHELDYHRSIRFHRESNCLKNIWRWIADKLERPPTLQEASRISIRKHLVKITGGRSILNHINALPLPQVVRNFIALKDLYTV